jgi:hypothetical protein
MGWRDLLATKGETTTLPWTGGRSLHSASRKYKLERRPPEHGWYTFTIEGTKATAPEPADPDTELLGNVVVGYLVGDRLVPDGTRIDPDPGKIVKFSEKVFLLPEELDRFSRVRAGRIYPEGPLIFLEEDFPLGPEEEVKDAYLDRKDTVTDIPGVVPALDAAFRMESFQRHQAEERRRELERRRAEEAARLERERKRQELIEKLGDGEGRRAMARAGDFRQAAEAALRVGGAEYLDHRQHGGRQSGEWLVTYKVGDERLQCVCDINLHIIDAGVCLVDHNTDEKGDTYFTLESLPAVIRQAIREHKLVKWRHG